LFFLQNKVEKSWPPTSLIVLASPAGLSNWPAFQAKSSAAELNLLSGSRIIKPKETQPTDFSWIYGTEPDGAWRVVRVVFAHIVPI